MASDSPKTVQNTVDQMTEVLTASRRRPYLFAPQL